MAPANRLIFLEYIMGDQDAAVRAHTAADAYSATQTELHLEEGPANSRRATNASIAQFLVDSALNNDNTAFQNQQTMTPHLSSHTSETTIVRVLEAVLENNNGALPEHEDDHLTEKEKSQKDSEPMPMEILEDVGILKGSE